MSSKPDKWVAEWIARPVGRRGRGAPCAARCSRPQSATDLAGNRTRRHEHDCICTAACYRGGSGEVPLGGGGARATWPSWGLTWRARPGRRAGCSSRRRSTAWVASAPRVLVLALLGVDKRYGKPKGRSEHSSTRHMHSRRARPDPRASRRIRSVAPDAELDADDPATPDTRHRRLHRDPRARRTACPFSAGETRPAASTATPPMLSTTQPSRRSDRRRRNSLLRELREAAARHRPQRLETALGLGTVVAPFLTWASTRSAAPSGAGGPCRADDLVGLHIVDGRRRPCDAERTVVERSLDGRRDPARCCRRRAFWPPMSAMPDRSRAMADSTRRGPRTNRSGKRSARPTRRDDGDRGSIDLTEPLFVGEASSKPLMRSQRMERGRHSAAGSMASVHFASRRHRQMIRPRSRSRSHEDADRGAGPRFGPTYCALESIVRLLTRCRRT